MALALSAVACSSSDSPTNTAGTTAGTTAGSTKSAADLSAKMSGVKLVSDGKLTICSDIPYTPFEYPNDNGGYTGFDVELVDAMAKSLGVATEWKVTPFDSIIPALAADSCDMIASATTITDERKEKVTFTQPYFDADQSLLILKKDEGTYKTLADLKGKTIGVQAGTTGADYANANKPEGATIKEYPGGEDLFAAIAADDIQAVLQDFPVNQARVVKNPNQFAVTETFPTGDKYGFAVNKTATSLAAALDAALAEQRSNGGYDAIYTTYFGAKK
jgi:polar amino acid transport system substrate-binding protein